MKSEFVEYPNGMVLTHCGRCDWIPNRATGQWIVIVGDFPFDVRIPAVFDDFGSLTPVARH